MRPTLQERIEQERQASIDLSPLIDVVFILLIFFIVTSVFIKDPGVPVDKPQAVTAEELENDLILLAITQAGEVIYDHSNIGIAGVRSTVAALLLADERPIVIQADRQVTTELLVRVIDEAKLGGATSVNIATTAER
jgi:biopolymer transport protein ExbD